MGESVRLVQHPAPRLYRQMASGETVFALGASGLHKLTDHAVESSESALTLTLSLYYRDGTKPISDITELRGKRVILMQGYSYGELGRYFEKESDSMRIIQAHTHKSALKMLQHDRADYLLDYQTPADTVMARNGLSGLKREVIGKVNVHFFASRALDNAEQLVEEWDTHLQELKRNDQLPPRDYYRMEK